MSEIDFDGVRVMGRDYGYPECCIEYFIAGVEAWWERCDGQRAFPLSRVSSHDGRIMCDACKESEQPIFDRIGTAFT